MRITLAVLIAFGSSVAAAQPDKQTEPDVTASTETVPPPDIVPPAPPPAPPDPGVVEPAHARPGQESGFVEEPHQEDSSGRKVARAVLFVPKTAVEILMSPIRLGVWVDEKYHPQAHFHRWFFNDANTFGLYPTVRYETAYGFRAGAAMELSVNDTDRIHATANTSFDGLRQHVGADYTLLRLDDRLDVGVRIELHRRQNELFYGVGNQNTTAAPAMPVVIGVDDTAVQSRYSSRLGRAAVEGGYRFAHDFQLRAGADVGRRDLGNGVTGVPVETAYAPMSLIGFNHYSVGYGELETRWDTRAGASTIWDPPSVISHGHLISLWGGRAALTVGHSFFRYGADLQQYIRVGASPRVIAARFHGEGISASADQVPITELPTLGGAHYLRGYPIDRFRDRITAVGSLEYQWDLSHIIFASLFVDVGRVYSSVDNLSFKDLRVGYGLAFELEQQSYHGVRGSISSSRDGGVFLDLSFEPVFNLKPRLERK